MQLESQLIGSVNGGFITTEVHYREQQIRRPELYYSSFTTIKGGKHAHNPAHEA